MPNMLFTNNAATTLAGAINASVTSLTVATGTGSLFPAPTGSQYFYCTLQSATAVEIVKVTARTGDTFTMVRGQDNTTGQSFAIGDKVELRLVAIELNDFPKLDEVNTFTQLQTLNGGIAGVYSPSTFAGTYSDGIVVDYTSGTGRVSVGSADALNFYNGGIANTLLGGFDTGKNFNAQGNLIANNGIVETAATINTSYTITTNNNALSAGPVTLASGVTVTVPTGSTWTVV